MGNDDIADELARKRWELTAARLNLEELHRKMRVVSARHELAINEEVTSDGRRRYTNERARRAALTVRLEEDDAYQAQVVDDRQLRTEVQILQGEIQDLRMRWMGPEY